MQQEISGSEPSDPSPEEPSGRRRFGWLFGRGTPAEPDPLKNAHSIHALKSIRVDDVAVPRADIRAIEIGLPLSKMIKEFKDSGYSRLPVYEESLDNPLGLLHLKDLALKYGFN